MLGLLGYVGGLLGAFFVGLGLLSFSLGVIPEEKPRKIHPRPTPVTESQQPVVGNYQWEPKVAPGITLGKTEPTVTDATHPREAAKVEINKPSRKIRHAQPKSPFRYARPHAEGAMALGYAGEPSIDRFRTW